MTGRPGASTRRARKPCTSICSCRPWKISPTGKGSALPRYNFIDGSSSHDLNGRLKPGRVPVEIEPADIIFIEGNFPFLIEEILHLIGIKVVYLTDDPVRMKRKWKRDIDYRKKYDPTYFRNRYFKDQFIMAQIAYHPQMEVCDMLVDTTGAALWTTPEIAEIPRPGLKGNPYGRNKQAAFPTGVFQDPV